MESSPVGILFGKPLQAGNGKIDVKLLMLTPLYSNVEPTVAPNWRAERVVWFQEKNEINRCKAFSVMERDTVAFS